MLIYPGLKRFVFIDVSILHPPHTQTHTHTHTDTHTNAHTMVFKVKSKWMTATAVDSAA